ncbi:MAG: creatininase family protein [Planctomycetes bacterium]|nr:creatininase family protein [Planctomycetota bacterium]
MAFNPVSWCLSDLCVPDIQEYLKEKDTVLIPIGAIEQHGLHLPLVTDAAQALEIARRAAAKARILYTPVVWWGYSPHHIGRVGEGTGTITLRASTLHAILNDIVRSLLHSGFRKFVIVNNQGSNIKIMDPILRKLRYDTGALICMSKLYAERYIGLIKNVMENPPEETPGWHSSELETSQMLAHNEKLVRMDRAKKELTHGPKWLPPAFKKADGTPDVQFEGFEYFVFPMEHRDFSDTGTIGNPLRATKDKGEQTYELYSNHLATALKEIEKIKVELRPGVEEFIDRAM